MEAERDLWRLLSSTPRLRQVILSVKLCSWHGAAVRERSGALKTLQEGFSEALRMVVNN